MADNFWEATQHALQGEVPIVKKPKLTDVLLRKPPFRFLHDVISEVQRNTGFASELFTGAETDAKAIQDKESKLAYLQKMIDFVSTTLSEPVVAKPAKIVAGLEPEATNLFLQMLARAATGQQQATLSSQPLAPQAAAQAAQPPAAAQDFSAPQSRQSPFEPMLGLQSEVASTASQPPMLPSTSSVNAEDASVRPVHRPTRSMAQPADSPGSTQPVTPSSTQNQLGAPNELLLRQPSGKEASQQEAVLSPLPRPSDAKQGTAQGTVPDRQQQPPDPVSLHKAAVPSRPERPTSARRGPPKIPQTCSAGRPQTPSSSMARPGTSSGRPGSAVRPSALSPLVVHGSTAQLDAAGPSELKGLPDRQVITSGRPRQLPLLPGARPASAGLKRPASAAGPSPAVALIEEGEGQEEEEDILVVTETMPASAGLSGQGAEGQGALVRNILEAEKALQEQVSQSGNAADQQGTGIILRRKKRDDSSPSKVGDPLVIADMVQRLCQSTNPLARCVEHLQEDLETMTTEFNFWAEERRRFQDQLAKQQESYAVTASSQTQLADLDSQLDAAEQRILSLKKTVLQNDMTIHKLLHLSVGVA